MKCSIVVTGNKCITLHADIRFNTNVSFLFFQNTHVQAFVFPDIWKSFSGEIFEGGLYIISNFYTRKATGTLRPTSSKIIIAFSNTTRVQKVEEDDFMIPRHKFELVDLSELFGIVSKYENPEAPEFSTGSLTPCIYPLFVLCSLQLY